MDKIEGWLLNVALGKFATRAAILIAAYVAGPIVQGLAAKAGLQIAIDPAKLQVEMMIGANAAFEWFKARRAANPNSPAIQTDASKPGAATSAAAAAAAPAPQPAP